MNSTKLTVDKVIKDFISACGPVRKESIINEVHIQWDDKFQDYQVAEVMNRLMKRGEIELYDTCDAWV